MTREQKIQRLQARGTKAAKARRWRAVTEIAARLSPLVTRQIKAELRAEKKYA